MWRRIWSRKWPAWAITLLFLCGTLLAMSAASALSKGREQRDHAVRAEATVIKVNRLASTSWDLQLGTPSALTVRHVEAFQHDPRVGDRIVVYFSAIHPTDPGMVTDARLGPPGRHLIARAKIAGILALVLLGLAIFGLTRRRDSTPIAEDMSAVREMGGLT
ncbi:hypothetical protein HUT06_37995 [Actinomadura sp. NAK00032]|uniref:hypothetical protein n=1 Tax=Actinomadura sp. NAK00032 TaxID=2742128 RepID=UPI001591BE85|nr:hypothetical protein [Actinomadura sp. NAK00032]QKW39105.1 hypothetical protein HUT06_37995 [Actinomadura sp. NAK00032]